MLLGSSALTLLPPPSPPVQDFLNEFHRHTWRPLPHILNAQKGIALHHPELWAEAEADVAIVHYTGGWGAGQGRCCARCIWHLRPMWHLACGICVVHVMSQLPRGAQAESAVQSGGCSPDT